MKKKHISFDDTEIASLEHALYTPFTHKIYTPEVFRKDFGEKHVRFNGMMEICYLHPSFFKPNDQVFHHLGIEKTQKYSILRFISWDANHDVGYKGFSIEDKYEAVKRLAQHGKVFISAEGDLPKDLEAYRLKIPVEKIHDVLAFAEVALGDSGTMMTEACLVGTPAVRVSSDVQGNFVEMIEKYELMHQYSDAQVAINKAEEILTQGLKPSYNPKKDRFFADKIDVTKFMIEEATKW